MESLPETGDFFVLNSCRRLKARGNVVFYAPISQAIRMYFRTSSLISSLKYILK